MGEASKKEETRRRYQVRKARQTKKLDKEERRNRLNKILGKKNKKGGGANRSRMKRLRGKNMTIASFLTAIHVIVALFMILVVLVQGGNSGGVGAAFGGGNSSGFFGASGGTTFFAKLTYGAAVVFMVPTPQAREGRQTV